MERDLGNKIKTIQFHLGICFSHSPFIFPVSYQELCFLSLSETISKFSKSIVFSGMP